MGLTALTTVAGVVITYLTRKNPSQAPPDPNPGPSVPVGPAPVLAQLPIPATADGQLELAKQLVAEVVRDRDETRMELAEARAMVQRLESRVRDQDVTINRLQQLLGVMPTPPYQQGQSPSGPPS